MVTTILQWAQLPLTVGMSGAVAFLFFRLALHVARPDWRAKQRCLADSDWLSQSEATELFARARAPLNSFFRLLAVGFMCVWALFSASLAVIALLLASPYPHLAVSSPVRGVQEILIEILFTTPVILGLWLVFKARSIQASQEIERIFHEVNNIPERDNPELVSAFRPGASSASVRWLGVGLILIGLFVGFKHWLPGLPMFAEMAQTIWGMVANMRNGA